MKTLKTVNSLNLLKNVQILIKNKRIRRHSDIYNMLMKLVRGHKAIATAYSKGSGRWSKTEDYTIVLSNILKELRIEHQILNDAPRGGKLGNYIKIITKVSNHFLKNEEKEEIEKHKAEKTVIEEKTKEVTVFVNENIEILKSERTIIDELKKISKSKSFSKMNGVIQFISKNNFGSLKWVDFKNIFNKLTN